MTQPGAIYRNMSKKHPKPKDGDLAVWWIPQIPGEPFMWPVANLKEAAMLLDVLAAYDDFQFAARVKGDYANMGGLNVYSAKTRSYIDWESEDCDDFDTYRHNGGSLE